MEKEKKTKTLETQPQKSFEEALERLEEIVTKLEQEEVPLEETISLFEEGMKLIEFCSKKIEQIKHKVEIIMKTKNGFEVQPFDEKVVKYNTDTDLFTNDNQQDENDEDQFI